MASLVDFHSHILPGIDDGSASVEESIALLQMEAKQGIQHVIATPHFYAQHDTLERFLQRRNRAEAQLRQEMRNDASLPRIDVGAEVYFFRGMSESELLPQLSIRGKRCILVEMPPSPWTDEMYRELGGIWEKQRITPIVAHVDRYISPFKTYQIPKRLSQMPVLIQANASFFLNKKTSSMAIRMLKADQIHLLGSDCHNMSTRQPNLGDARRYILRELGPSGLAKVHRKERIALEL